MRRRLPSNWRKRLQISERDFCNFTELQLHFQKGKTPKGFLNYVGEISVDNTDDAYVEGVNILPYFRTRGLGRLLYKEILKRKGKMSTLYSSASPEAQRVWRSLIRDYKYETDFFTGRLTIFA